MSMLSALTSFLFPEDSQIQLEKEETNENSSVNASSPEISEWTKDEIKEKTTTETDTPSPNINIPKSLSGFLKELVGMSPEETSTETSPSLIDQQESSDSPLPVVVSPVFSEAFLPSIELLHSTPESILSVELAINLRQHLPNLLKEAHGWTLIYSMDEHGISMGTLYRTCNENPGPMLLIIKDTQDAVFGAFANDTLHVASGYYGEGGTFLWKLGEELKVFHATGANEYLIYTEAHCVAFGGGGGRFGLWFDEDLDHGHSEPCETFGNEALASSSDFRIQQLEIWGFQL